MVAWKKEALKDKAPEGAIGGRFTYSFTPNSIGTTVEVTDSITGASLNVTDYKDW